LETASSFFLLVFVDRGHHRLGQHASPHVVLAELANGRQLQLAILRLGDLLVREQFCRVDQVHSLRRQGLGRGPLEDFRSKQRLAVDRRDDFVARHLVGAFEALAAGV
jgi:hypothetical protein